MDTESRYSLRFIGGRFRGGVFPLPDGDDLIMGRAPDAGICLPEDMVSRQHARISIQDDVVSIEDLGSTNGIYVNGDQVKRAELVAGDRILIGATLVKLLKNGKGGPRDQTREDEAAASGLAGRIPEIGLPEVLQLCATGTKTGDLRIRTDGDEVTVHLRDGKVAGVTSADVPNIDPYKALYRALSWEEGEFELLAAGEDELGDPLPESVEAMLMEGLRQRDELANIASDLPAPDAAIEIVAPLAAALRALTPELLDTLQLAWNYGSIRGVMNHSAATDLDTANEVLYLLRNDYVRER